jgi:RNA polymerase primary sigma factor
MNLIPQCKQVIDIIFSEYQNSGFITEKRILDISHKKKLSLAQINSICEYIFSNGVFLSNGAIDEVFETDYAHSDYTLIYNQILEIDPGLSYLVTYVRNIKAPQKREPQKLLPQIKDGNLYARNRFFEMYLRIVLRMALQFHKKYKFSLADTIQEGAIGLIMALDKYEYGSSNKFSSYAPWWIRQIVFRYMSIEHLPFDFPIHIKDKLLEICPFLINKSEESKYLNRKKLVNRVCLMLSCSEQKSIRYISYFDIPMETSKYCVNTIHLLSDNEEKIILRIEMEKVLSTLLPREQEVIKMRFGIGGEGSYTLEEIGARMGLTRERVRQIETKALKQLERSRKLKSLF